MKKAVTRFKDVPVKSEFIDEGWLMVKNGDNTAHPLRRLPKLETGETWNMNCETSLAENEVIYYDNTDWEVTQLSAFYKPM